MKYFGAHVSAAGGVENAPLNAAAIGADAFALFTKNQRQWSAPPLSEESVAAFQENCRKCGFAPENILPHDSYLINLGQPDDVKCAAARAAFTAELERCARLGLKKLNFHPGSNVGKLPIRECLCRIAEGIRMAVDAVPGVMAVIENTAGQGNVTGASFEELAQLVELVDRPGQVGICIDTCHAFAAGYDLASEEGYEWTMAQFARNLDFSLLEGMHLNDSKGALGKHLDRHESMGKGVLGEACFRRIAADIRLDGVPMILETPVPELWAEEIAALRKMIP